MKISKSKQELARIIIENGGWRNGEFAAQDGDGGVGGYEVKPEWDSLAKYWWREASGQWFMENKIKNHHQTVLSRDEYFHLYPAQNANDGWILWNGGECPVAGLSVVDVKYFDAEGFVTGIALDFVWGPKTNIVYYRKTRSESEQAAQEPKPVPAPEAEPTIEQLAADYHNRKDYADRKQEEADDAKADAEAKLAELIAAGKALGLVLSVVAPESELVLSVAPVQKYTGKFYNAELGEAPAYGKNTRDAVCDWCGKRYGEHYGDRCKSGSER